MPFTNPKTAARFVDGLTKLHASKYANGTVASDAALVLAMNAASFAGQSAMPMRGLDTMMTLIVLQAGVFCEESGVTDKADIRQWSIRLFLSAAHHLADDKGKNIIMHAATRLGVQIGD